ncbi:MAG TPA: response regulator, partial [Gemmatales bacterium]|nr:response regulator [Gemmatales bacterium]
DSPAVKKGIDQVLRQAGYVVMLSSNSGEAFDRIKTCCVPSLIIVDELLPEIDGFHIVKLLRNTKSTQQVPILMLTRQSGFFLKMKATWKGVNEYLAKPLAPDKLLAAVQKLCPVQT